MKNGKKEIFIWISLGILTVCAVLFFRMSGMGYKEIRYTHPEITEDASDETVFVINVSTKKIHLATCYQAERIREENRIVLGGENKEEEITVFTDAGYTFCGICGKKYTEKE